LYKEAERKVIRYLVRHWPSLAICCAVLGLVVCCSPKHDQIIDPKDLENIKLGEVVRLSGLLKRPAEAVCVLAAYRDRLDEGEPLSRQVNAHLTAMKFGLHKGGWALVFVDGDKVSVQTFKERDHNMVTWHEGVPRNFKPVQCTSVARALVTKVDNFWPALIIGEER
jgi:hypothetical protein